MFQIIYHSRYTVSASGLSTIRDILSVSETNNYRNGITGFLIFDKSSFVQVLEGERGAVEDTYLRICNDPRHSRPTVIEARDMGDRAFPDWAMGGFIRSPEAQDIYARHGLTGGLEASSLTADQVIGLAQDLAASEQLRQARRTLGR
ncbi:BLUF domain-containing protein [Asticcacaulis sp. 201]|uniref:BLUF domain-containing protein n=1 Tax=Asticcacaulis sp. 201 TaxID=3028787 RepID=UPI002916E54C|nr:BLUF domain-containing protein [Asticcacaulis sp. 201]MDV6331680.1 BLUF domain-containing protein [Asticcacaulis sp. 201]